MSRQEIVISLQINLRITLKVEEGSSLPDRFNLSGQSETGSARIELPDPLPLHIEAVMTDSVAAEMHEAEEQAIFEREMAAAEAAAAMEPASTHEEQQERTAVQIKPARKATKARMAKLGATGKRRPLSRPPQAAAQAYMIARRSSNRRRNAIGKGSVIALEPARGPTASGRPLKIPKRRIFRKHARSIGPPLDKPPKQQAVFLFGRISGSADIPGGRYFHQPDTP